MRPALPVATKKSRAAFTFVEMLVATAVSAVLGGIIYTMGSEALFSFSRNVSLNRAYSEARSSMDRIGTLLQASGHVPVLLNEDGSLWATTASNGVPGTNPSEAAGVRFYCYGSQPSYDITTCTTTGNTMAVAVPAKIAAPKIGDVVAINAVGFQGIVASVTGTTIVTMTFTNMSGTAATSIASLCSSNSSSVTDLSSYYCLLFNRVAFIAVSTPALGNPAAVPTAANAVPATATELRYYSDANVLTKYKVIAHLTLNQTDAQETLIKRPRPFQVLATPTVTVTLCEQAPDYTNRAPIISDATTFTRVQSSFGSRCPLLLTGPW